jgi:hypothetical protein
LVKPRVSQWVRYRDFHTGVHLRGSCLVVPERVSLSGSPFQGVRSTDSPPGARYRVSAFGGSLQRILYSGTLQGVSDCWSTMDLKHGLNPGYPLNGFAFREFPLWGHTHGVPSRVSSTGVQRRVSPQEFPLQGIRARGCHRCGPHIGVPCRASHPGGPLKWASSRESPHGGPFQAPLQRDIQGGPLLGVSSRDYH